MIPGAPSQITGGSLPVPDPTGEAQQATGNPAATALLQLLQQSQRPHVAGQELALPSQMQQQSTQPPAYMTNNAAAHAWGPERFMYTLGSSLNNLAQQKQQNQLAQAKNMYGSFMTALDKYVKPDGQLDPNFANDPFIRSMKPQDFKKMSKALAAPWLDPGKTTVEQTAMSQVMQERQKKEQAQQGLKKLFTQLKDKAFKPNPQLTPGQQSQVTGEIAGKVPLAGSSDTKTPTAIAEAMSKIQESQAQLDLRRDQLTEKAQNDLDSLKYKYDTLQQKSDTASSQYATNLAKIQEQYDSLKQRADAADKTLTERVRHDKTTEKTSQDRADTAANKATGDPAKLAITADKAYRAALDKFNTWKSSNVTKNAIGMDNPHMSLLMQSKASRNQALKDAGATYVHQKSTGQNGYFLNGQFYPD